MEYLAFSGFMLVAQFSPGPDMLLLIRNALTHSRRAGLWTVAGITAGLCVHLTLVLTGLALAVRDSRFLFPALLIAGGLWLLRMGFFMVRHPPPPPDPARLDVRVPLGDRAAFLQGFLTNLTNAKAVLFLATVVLGWLGAAPSWHRKSAAALIILGQAAVFWSLFVIALQHPAVRRGWHKTARPLHLLFGCGLLALGLHALWSGIASFC